MKAICLPFAVFDLAWIALIVFEVETLPPPVGVERIGLWMPEALALVFLVLTPRNLTFTEDGMGVGPIFMRRPLVWTPWVRRGRIVTAGRDKLYAFMSIGMFLLLGRAPEQVAEQWPT